MNSIMCKICGDVSPEEGYSKRYRNTCRPCGVERDRQAVLRKTGVARKPKRPIKDGKRECSSCETLKSEDEFALRKTPKGKVVKNSVCITCLNEYQRQRQGDLEAKLLSKNSRKRHQQNPVNKKKAKDHKFLSKYGITSDDKERMIAENNGKCPICNSKDPGRTWVIDHCHNTGRVRGILCDNCNKMLGLAKDDMIRLVSGALYLSRHYLNHEPGTATEGVPKPDEEWEGEAE